MPERRHSHRSRTFARAEIVFNNRASVIDCIVRDISAHGACSSSPALSVCRKFSIL